jgi:signal transduction histidine kinase
MPVDLDRGEVQGRLLLALASRITGTLDLQEVLDESFAALRQLVDFGGGAIQLVEDGHLVAAATDPPMDPEARTVRIPVGQGISGTIAATGDPIYIADIATDDRVHPEGRKKGVSSGVRSYFGVPLIAHGGPIGVLQVDAPEVDAFGPDIRALVLAFVPAISAAVQNALTFGQEREAAARLREADQLKEDFLAIVSHELRTPLTTMLGFAETLAGHLDELPPGQAVDLAQRIKGAGDRLARLIEDLLYASRIERGLVELLPGPVDVAACVRTAIGEVGVPDRPVTIDVAESLPPVRADADRLLQVLDNLLSNAAKYAAGATVTILLEVIDGKVHIAVKDTGPGISPEHLEHLFRRFYRVPDTNTQVRGTGLGLFICRQIVTAHGGEISVESELGKGTAFHIYLPCKQPKSDQNLSFEEVPS